MIPNFLEFGTQQMLLDPPKLISRYGEPDTRPVSLQHSDGNLYRIGTTHPDYPRMPIIERECYRDGPVFIYNLQLEGIDDAEKFFLETSFEETEAEEGWDEVTWSVFTNQPYHNWFKKGEQLRDPITGNVMVGFEFMWITDIQRRRRSSGYYDVGLKLKGLRFDKPAKRRIGSTSQAIAARADGTVYFGTYYGWPAQFGGLSTFSVTDANVEFDLPQVSVTDTLLSKNPPPTLLVPGFWTPPDAPDVFVIPLGIADATYHCPYGWKVLNLQSEQIPGKSLWLISITWGYQRADTPS